MTPNKPRKRSHAETREFMPLSKSKLFESDDDANCEYDWGFKKSDKTIVKDTAKAVKAAKEIQEKTDKISRKFAYKCTNPIDLKDEDREIYMSNLTKIYNRSYVYIPSFYAIDDVTESTDKMIATEITGKLREDLTTLRETLDKYWEPLYQHYVLPARLPSCCSAFKLISRCREQFTRAKCVFESCIADGIKPHAAALKTVLTEMANKDAESVINIFKVAVGDVLLQHASDPSVTLDQMSTDSNRVIFNRMVLDDLDTVKSRVEAGNVAAKRALKAAGKRSKKATDEQESDEDLEVDAEETVAEDRPASKAILANKGLVPRRKKVDSNPRVKHRMKFKKAIVRYHSQVPRSRDDMANYSGEQSGIRIGVIKAKKIK